MKRIHYILIIILIALAFLVIFDFTTSNLTSNTYNLPDDYELLENNSGNLTFSNGKNQIILFELDDNFSIDTYMEHFSDRYNITVEDFSLNEHVKKTVTTEGNATVAVKYWFNKNNESYQIHVSRNDYELDQIVNEMILNI